MLAELLKRFGKAALEHPEVFVAVFDALEAGTSPDELVAQIKAAQIAAAEKAMAEVLGPRP